MRTPRHDRDLYAHAGPTQHLDQHVQAEPTQLAPLQIADPGLSDPHHPGRRSLRPAAFPDEIGERDHQIGAVPEVLRFLAAEADVAKDVPAATSHLHTVPLSFRSRARNRINSRYRARPICRSRPLVLRPLFSNTCNTYTA